MKKNVWYIGTSLNYIEYMVTHANMFDYDINYSAYLLTTIRHTVAYDMGLYYRYILP